MGSVFKKIKTIAKDGLEPFIEGKKNYDKRTPKMEELALKRSLVCIKCPQDDLVLEPIDMLKVKDDIKRISNKMCNQCGCSAPYLLRQNVKICKFWDDDKI